jgi:hypothetical protein
MSVESRMRGNPHVRFGGRPGERTSRKADTAPQVDPYSVVVVSPRFSLDPTMPRRTR